MNRLSCLLKPTLGAVLVTVGLSLVASAGHAMVSGQETGALQIAAAQHNPAGTVTITLNGPGASALTAEDLSTTIAGIDLGTPTPIDDAGSPAATSLVLLFETSSGMGFGRLEQAQVAALAIVDQLAFSDRIAVVTFDDQTQVLSDFTTDRTTTRTAIESLELGSTSALYDGVDTAARLFDQSVPGSETLLILGAGWDFGAVSTVGRAESADAARLSNATVFWLPFGVEFDIAYFNELTTNSGGRQLTLSQLDSLVPELASLAPESQTFRFQSPVLPAGPLPLVVTTDEETAATVLNVTNEGLLQVDSIAQPAPDQPFVLTLSSVVPLSTLEVEATSRGLPLPLDTQTGELRIDPWAFEPGPLEVRLTASVDGKQASSTTASLEIPSLQPQVLGHPVESAASDEDPAIELSWRAQGAADLTLLVTINNQLALQTPDSSVTVTGAGGDAIEASLVNVDGAAVASWSGTITPGQTDPQTDQQTAPTDGDANSSGWRFGGLPALLAITGAAIAALIIFFRRARHPQPPIAATRGTIEGNLLRDTSVAVEDTPPISSPPPSPPQPSPPLVRLQPSPPPARPLPSALQPSAVSPHRPKGAVVVRSPGMPEVHIPITGDQFSVGASKTCDIVLTGGEVRYVHLMLRATSDFIYRATAFGPVKLVETGAAVEDDTLVTVRQWLAISDHLIAIEHW